MSRHRRRRPTTGLTGLTPTVDSQEYTITVASRITDITRRRLIEGLANTAWYGTLNDVEFLDRLYDLDTLPTTDPRSSQFPTAHEDIIQHCVANVDWPNDWIFDDERFGLADSDDALLRFLTEMLHPAVRTDPAKVEQLLHVLNQTRVHDRRLSRGFAVGSGTRRCRWIGRFGPAATEWRDDMPAQFAAAHLR